MPGMFRPDNPTLDYLALWEAYHQMLDGFHNKIYREGTRYAFAGAAHAIEQQMHWMREEGLHLEKS